MPLDEYRKLYEFAVKEASVSMQFQAVSIATQVPTDLVKKILVDFTQALVEISRKTAKEARIQFHNTGHLHLFKNRELAFQHISADCGMTAQTLQNERDAMRDDISVIDSASAVLSTG